MSPLLRLVAWGIAASGALAIAVLAAQSDMGERRVAAATAPLAAQTEAARAATAQAMVRALDAEREAKRLGDTVRSLQADRDKLAGRLAALETSVEDLTGSIAQANRRSPVGSDLFMVPPGTPPASFKPPEPAAAPKSLAAAAEAHPPVPDPRALPPIEPREAPAPPPTTVATAVVPPTMVDPVVPSVVGTVAGMDPSEIPLPRPNPLANNLATQAAATRTPPPMEAPAPAPAPDTGNKRFAIEIGGPASIDTLRALWTKVREGQSGDLVADLKPAIALRDAAKPGLVEMRLVAGPVPTSLAAARLCASLSISGIACRATPYEGQMLTLP
ncbi:MAG: hypothetical protein HXX10_07075 [Rhodoplanes sp.]|uniref:hypothetical protein n=1 Tax=Rhodoplanes sp. TaxID=1968906 RepID=UPI00178F7D86|nr:hypothetical protein [Rhodoplanes sp.]NVO13781.1 hypothetical protein [Rhodoplanes sp.]